MALKQCEYCRSFTDSKNTRCPFCSAPLNNKIIPEEGNLKETIALKVAETINKVLPSASSQAKSAQSNENAAPNNGTTTSKEEKTPDGKRMLNKWIVLFLAIFGGVFGVHRFYEGKIFTGILFLITFGFLGIGLFIDILLIIVKPTTYPAKR